MSSFSQPAAAPVPPEIEHVRAHLALHSTNTLREPASETAVATRPVGFSTKAEHPLDDHEVEPQDQPAQLATQALVILPTGGPGTGGTGAGIDHIEDELAFKSTPLDSYTRPFAATAVSRRTRALISPLTNCLTSSLGRTVIARLRHLLPIWFSCLANCLLLGIACLAQQSRTDLGRACFTRMFLQPRYVSVNNIG